MKLKQLFCNHKYDITSVDLKRKYPLIYGASIKQYYTETLIKEHKCVLCGKRKEEEEKTTYMQIRR